jgi:hypothetical protein
VFEKALKAAKTGSGKLSEALGQQKNKRFVL